jgi:hypothetical protein
MATVNRVIINNSDFQSIYIGNLKDSLQEISISNNNIEEMALGIPASKFEWNVQNSSLNSGTFKIWVSHGIRADMSKTKGFPNVIKEFYHLEVNLSSCNLSELPNSYLRTVTLDLSRNKLKGCKILYFTRLTPSV